MNKKREKIIVGLIIGAIIFIVGSYFYSSNFHKNIRNHKQMFCYETFRGSSNSAFVIENLLFKDSLVKYYKDVEKGENPIFNFPLKTLPTDNPVFVINYIDKDSLIVEVVSYYDRGIKFGGDYLRGYVYGKTLHKSPPMPKILHNE